MIYDVKTPSEYISQLDDDWRRETLEEIRSIIKEQAPQLEESIHYKMLGYGADNKYVFHLNAQRRYVSLYVGNAAKVDPDGAFTKGLSVGKGCVRFTKSNQVAHTEVDKLIVAAYSKWRLNHEFDC